jgi:tRNA(Arg) A34 adenosine deaminase TadA
MSDNDSYMRGAIEAAKHAEQTGGVAIGAVLVDSSNGEVVAAGGSLVGLTHDPTAHAEVNAIRNAAKRFETDNLGHLVLYCTLEPCHMCLSAAAWARIPTVYFGAYRKDVSPDLFDINGDFSDETEGARMNLRNNTHMTVKGGVLEAECAELLVGYGDKLTSPSLS